MAYLQVLLVICILFGSLNAIVEFNCSRSIYINEQPLSCTIKTDKNYYFDYEIDFGDEYAESSTFYCKKKILVVVVEIQNLKL